MEHNLHEQISKFKTTIAEKKARVNKNINEKADKTTETVTEVVESETAETAKESGGE